MPDCRPCLTKLCNLVGYPAWPAGRTCNFPFPNGKRLSQEPRCFNVLMFSLRCRCERIVVSLFVRRSFSSFWALLPLEDLQDPVVRACTLRKWNPRPACGTAFSSVCISISVCVCVSTPVSKGTFLSIYFLS